MAVGNTLAGFYLDHRLYSWVARSKATQIVRGVCKQRLCHQRLRDHNEYLYLRRCIEQICHNHEMHHLEQHSSLRNWRGIRINQSSDIPTLTQTSVCENTPYQIDSLAYTDAGSNTIAETCPPTGACCTNGECVIALEEDCLTFHGSWNGIGSTCYERDCTPGCTGDVNVDGLVNVLDLLEVIAVWGTCP